MTDANWKCYRFSPCSQILWNTNKPGYTGTVYWTSWVVNVDKPYTHLINFTHLHRLDLWVFHHLPQHTTVSSPDNQHLIKSYNKVTTFWNHFMQEVCCMFNTESFAAGFNKSEAILIFNYTAHFILHKGLPLNSLYVSQTTGTTNPFKNVRSSRLQ